MQTAHVKDSTPVASVLTIALELATKSWKLAIQDDNRARPAIHTGNAEGAKERLAEVAELIESIKKKWHLAEPVRVVVMYEAGQDGFWLYRALQSFGYEVLVVDPASIPVERQARRAKTDRLDAQRLLCCLRGWLRGERDRVKMVRVPSPEAENLRHLARERGQLQKEVGQHRDRIRKLLRTVGCWIGNADGKFPSLLDEGAVRCHDGTPLPSWLLERLRRECARLELVAGQLKALEATTVTHLPTPARQNVRTLQRLRGVGPVSAFRLTTELFWRKFNNRRQVGACVGLVPQPYDSGQSRVDQGISKQGNRRVRSLLIEMAWMWIRHQPESAITKWFEQRTQGAGPAPGAGKRGRRIAIVAVARRLVIALWKYLVDGALPEGAAVKTA